MNECGIMQHTRGLSPSLQSIQGNSDLLFIYHCHLQIFTGVHLKSIICAKYNEKALKGNTAFFCKYARVVLRSINFQLRFLPTGIV
jgi:hypothetical protein